MNKIILNILVLYISNNIPSLNHIAHRESRNNYLAVNYNTNNTYDWGKYQLNDITFIELNKHYGLNIPNKKEFLNNPIQQEFYAITLMLHHRKIVQQRGYNVSYFNDINSWSGVYGCYLK